MSGAGLPEVAAFVPASETQRHAAARVTERYANGPEDLALLLDALDLTDHAPETPMSTTQPPAPADAPPSLVVRIDDTADLIAWGHDHETAAVKALARRAADAVAALAEHRDQDTVRREAAARVAQLREQLAAAENDLRAATGRPGRRTPEQLANVRTWARENGYEVSGHGMPPRTVLDAYDAAHPEEAAA